MARPIAGGRVRAHRWGTEASSRNGSGSSIRASVYWTNLYLHDGLDIDEANAYWSRLTGIPVSQFGKPYRAQPDGGIRNSKHAYGCPRITYCCSRTHRAIMGLVHGLLNVVELPVHVPEEFGPFHGV